MALIKQQLYSQCQAFLTQRLQTIQSSVQDVERALLSETKSSAGDKHETGRAMLQLERENISHSLAEAEKELSVLNKINNIKHRSKVVALGSIVYTSKANYFIAISAGKLQIDSLSFYAISISTPIGQLLISKKVGDTVMFREEVISITKLM